MRMIVNGVRIFFQLIGTKFAIDAKCGHGAYRDAPEAFEAIRCFVTDPQ